MIFTIKMHCQWSSLWKPIANDFYPKNALPMIIMIKYTANHFTIKMYHKWFFYENALQIFLLKKLSVMLPIEMYCQWSLP